MLIVLFEYIVLRLLCFVTSCFRPIQGSQASTISLGSLLTISLSAIALLLSVTQFYQNRTIRKSRKMSGIIIDSWNRAIDNLLADPSSRVQWISAARIFGLCQNNRELVTSEEDKKTLEAEIQFLREKAYPLFTLSAANYAGNVHEEIDTLPPTYFQGGNVVSEISLCTIWNTIKYPDNPNEHYPDITFSSTQLGQLPTEVRTYIQAYRRGISIPE